MKNFIQPGKIMDFTAPSGGVTGGNALKIGGLIVVPAADVDETKTFAGHTEGVFTLDKKTGETWVEGDVLYFDNSTGAFTKTSVAGLFRGGVAAEAVTVGTDILAAVRLDGVSTVAE